MSLESIWNKAPIPTGVRNSSAELLRDPEFDASDAIAICHHDCSNSMKEGSDAEVIRFSAMTLLEYGIWYWRTLYETRKNKDHGIWATLVNELNSEAIFRISTIGRAYNIDVTPIELGAIYCRSFYTQNTESVFSLVAEGNYSILYWPLCLYLIPDFFRKSDLITINLGMIRLDQLFRESGALEVPDVLVNGLVLPNAAGGLSNLKHDSILNPSYTQACLEKIKAAVASLGNLAPPKVIIAEARVQKQMGYSALHSLQAKGEYFGFQKIRREK